MSGPRIALSIPCRPIILGQAPCMPRNHQIFVRRDGPRGSPAAGYRDPRAAAGVRRFIEVHTEPCGLLTHAAPNFGGVLADARGEDQRVQPAEGGGERSQLPADSIDKQGDGIGRVRVGARQQGPHVIANAGNAEQPRGMIQQVAYRLRRHTFFLDQVENDARIEVAAAAAHWQAIECGEAHGRCHTLASVHRTHAGAAAEMGDHHATIRFCRTKDIRKNAGDVFIG